MDEKKIASAVRAYENLKKAQKAYYDRKVGPVEQRRPRGRPSKKDPPYKKEQPSKVEEVVADAVEFAARVVECAEQSVKL
jgi:hypothetical protein